MSLVLEGLSLAIEAGGLVIDCACCIKEKCEAIACAKDIDCNEAGKTPDAQCFCRAKKCTSNPSCVNDEDCPDGQECVDGVCLPKCRGQPCSTDGNCLDDCVCLEGGCWPESEVYYCHGDPNDPDAEGECKKGVPQVTKGGPFLTYGMCAQSGCKAQFSCNPLACDCYPDRLGAYYDLVSCQQACCGGSGDLGRCCESRVTYDADGNVTNVTQGCAATVPDPVTGADRTCCGDCDNKPTSACPKELCISDDPLQNGQAGTRVFRQFNSLFSNCDLCPTVTIGPCCYEKDGQPTCDMHDRGECENVLDGEWKGNNWFDCENARDPDVDLLIDFACPNCNGAGDCECGGRGFCHGQKCRDCNNPVTVSNTSFERIDNNPIIGDKWKFRSRDCNGDVSTQDQEIVIYGEKSDGTRVLLTTVDNSEANSDGLTEWTFEEEGCFSFLVAQKAVGNPNEAQLCMDKIGMNDTRPPANCEPTESPNEGECECYGTSEAGKNCEDDGSLAYAIQSWGPMDTPPDQARWTWKDDVTEDCRQQYSFRWWYETQGQEIYLNVEECPDGVDQVTDTITEYYIYYSLLMWEPGKGWTDVTDKYVKGLPYTIGGFGIEIPNGLREESVETLSGCDGGSSIEMGSQGVYQGLAPPPCEIPDLNENCPQRNISSENPLP